MLKGWRVFTLHERWVIDSGLVGRQVFLIHLEERNFQFWDRPESCIIEYTLAYEDYHEVRALTPLPRIQSSSFLPLEPLPPEVGPSRPRSSHSSPFAG